MKTLIVIGMTVLFTPSLILANSIAKSAAAKAASEQSSTVTNATASVASSQTASDGLLQETQIPTTLRNLCFVNQEIVEMSEAECDKAQREEQGLKSAEKGKMEKALKKRRWKKALEDMELSSSVSLLNLELIEGLDFGLKYRVKVENNHRRDEADKYFTRLDKWRIKAKLAVGDLIDNDTPLRLNISDKAEITFAQHFTELGEAYKFSNMKTPKDLPLNAKKAIKRLEAGNYVRFEANMNVLAGAGQVFPLGSAFEAQAGYHYVLGGEYEIHLFRLDDNRVRLKMVGDRVKGTVFEIEAGLGTGDMTGLTKRVTRWTHLDEMVEAYWRKVDNDLLLLDYTLDLNNEKAAKAYNDLFSSKKVLKMNTLRIIGPDKSFEELRNKLISNASMLEELSAECALITDKRQCAVKRNFKASNQSHTKARGFEIDLFVAETGRETIFRENRLANVRRTETGSEVTDHYLFPTLTMISEKSLFFDRFEKEVIRSANAVITSDSKKQATGFKNIGFSLKYEDKVFSRGEQEQLISHVQSILPKAQFDALLAKLEKQGWKVKKEYNGMDILIEYFLHEQALATIMRAGYANRSKLHQAMKDYIFKLYQSPDYHSKMARMGKNKKRYVVLRDRKGQPKLDRNGNVRYIRQKHNEKRDLTVEESKETLYRWYKRDIDKVVKILTTVFSSPDKVSAHKKYKAFLELRENKNFRTVGAGFLMNLVDIAAKQTAASFEDLVYFSIDMRARRTDRFTHTIGNNDKRELYALVRFIEAVLNDRGDDALEFGNIDSVAQDSQRFGKVEEILENKHVVITN